MVTQKSRRPFKKQRFEFEPLEDRLMLAIDIRLDFSLDTNNFFVGNQVRIDTLQAAVDVFENRITDTLDAINVGTGGNTWTAIFNHPGTGVQQNLVNTLNVAAGEYVLFAGGRALGSLGLGGPGGFGVSGSQAFVDSVVTRGQSNVGTTDFAPWGGAITFDTGATWNFDHTRSPGPGENDLFSVALHEVAHALGFGTADSFNAMVNSGFFTGTNAKAEFDASPGSNIPMHNDNSHFAEGTTEGNQEAAMDPTITVGTRKIFTELDFAALDDIGWDVSAPTDEVGVYRGSASRFFLDQGNNGTADVITTFGANGDTSLVGDFNGDGIDDVAVYRGSSSTFFIDHDANGTLDQTVQFGSNGDTPLVGDWNGDGFADIGVYRGTSSTFFLDSDRNGSPDFTIRFGANGDTPIVGDWDGDGDDDIGVHRGGTTPRFFLDTNKNGSNVEISFTFGSNGDAPIVGDWDGDGDDDVGIHRSTTSQFFLDQNKNGTVSASAQFGASTDTPIVGDWDGNGADGIGVHRASQGRFFLNNNINSTVDATVIFGSSTDTPIIGNWPNALGVAGGAAASPVADPSLSAADANSIVDAAIEILAANGLSGAELQTLYSTDVRIEDLAGGTLGLAYGGAIVVDVNGAGHGWFVDATPTQNEEFSVSSDGLIALADSAADGRVDLLTVVLHELGHILGHDHDGDGLMHGELDLGTRQLPDA